MYIGADNPIGQNFNVNRNLLSLRAFATTFKQVWFYTIFFMILYMFIAPGQGLTTLWGRNFDVNRKVLSLRSFVASLEKSLCSLILYIFFHDFNMYITPGHGQTASRGQSFDINRNVLSLHSFVESFKKMSLKSDFIHFLSWFNTCI